MSEDVAAFQWLEWKCLVCGNEQTTHFRQAADFYAAICSRCRTVHVADRHSTMDANPRRTEPVDLPLAPNGHPLTVGPVAFQKAQLLPAVAQPKTVDDGTAP